MTARDICALRPISEVFVSLGGDPPKHGRARAFWRDGSNNPQAVSLSDDKGVWFCHRDQTGGGVLKLIMHVRDCSRADALRWIADLNGVTLEDRQTTAAERREFARRRARAQQEGAELAEWKERLLDGIKRVRARWWDAYHGSLRYILENGLDAPLGDAMATLHEIAEERIELLHSKIDRLAAAPFVSLVPMFRALKGVAA